MYLSDCLFSYNGVCYNPLKLSISDNVVKKVTMEMERYIFWGGTIFYSLSLCTKIPFIHYLAYFTINLYHFDL